MYTYCDKGGAVAAVVFGYCVCLCVVVVAGGG